MTLRWSELIARAGRGIRRLLERQTSRRELDHLLSIDRIEPVHARTAAEPQL